MNDVVRWGVLGTGAAAAAFTRELLAMPDAAVGAVGSRTRAAAERFARRHGVERAHGSWQALVEDGGIDVIYVATPASTHCAAAAACIDAGRAVLCEKPLTLNAGEARLLTELARERGTFLMEAMWMRCNPAIRAVAALVARGELGRVVCVQADLREVERERRVRSRELGGGALLDNGVYGVSLAHLVLGAPDTVDAWAQTVPDGVDGSTGVLLGYRDGALALLSCGIVANAPCTATIVGTEARVDLPHDFTRPFAFTVHRDGREPVVVRSPFAGHGYVHEAAEAMRCLREGLLESPLVSWRASVEVMEVLDAARARIGLRYPSERRAERAGSAA